LGPHERAALAGLDVLEVDDAVRLPVELDLQSLLEIRGGPLHFAMALSAAPSWVESLAPAAPGPPTRPAPCGARAGVPARLRPRGPARGTAPRSSRWRTCRRRGAPPAAIPPGG